MQIKLQEGEQILFEGRPEKKILAMWIFTKVMLMSILFSFITFYILMLLFVFFIAIPSGNKNVPFPHYLWKVALILAPVWFLLLLIYYKNLKKTFHYFITNQRCIFEGGIFVKRLRNVPYHKITDVEINQNIIERFIGLYSLKIFTPGTGSVGVPGFEKAEIVFCGLLDAQKPASIVQEMLKKYKATGE